MSNLRKEYEEDRDSAFRATVRMYHAVYFAAALASVDFVWPVLKPPLGPAANEEFTALQDVIVVGLQAVFDVTE